MGLLEEDRKALINLKIERANETIREVPYHIEKGFYRTAANRLYYSCYYIVSALLLQNNFETHSHKGIINLFSLHYVKTNIVGVEEGKLYRSLFELRQTGDYDEVKIISKENVEMLLPLAENFIKKIEKLIIN